MTGYIDSVYCGSGVDGQGLRCVVFFSGCNLRCPFCHNPETLFKAGETTEADALLQKLKRYKPYFRRGGVTLSGGEPFMQADFFLELAGKLRAAGIRVCAETNGHICDERLIAACDEIICDVKNQQTDDLSVYEKFFSVCLRQGKAVRVTNVLVPEKNDSEDKIASLARLLSSFFSSSAVRFLPFRKLCEEKYSALGMSFPYASVREADETDIDRAVHIFTEKAQKILK